MNNNKYRRLLKKVPEDLSVVLANISAEWVVLSYKTGGPGWSADIEVKGRKFRLNSEYNYIAVAEMVGSSFRAVRPQESYRINISPQQVAALINGEIG
jgi:hypothetical protein